MSLVPIKSPGVRYQARFGAVNEANCGHVAALMRATFSN